MAKKYKKPENTKPTYRKDIDNYTHDDKDGKMNPFSTGEKQLNVLRKTDKEVVDTGDLYVKYNADDRLYKDIEDAEYNPKHAAKVLKKRQDSDEKLSKDQIRDKIENLTREGKEKLVRAYINKQTLRYLKEQADNETDETTEEPIGIDDEPIEPAAGSAALDTTSPTPDANNVTPESNPTNTDTKTDPVSQLGNELKTKNNFERVGSLLSIIQTSLSDVDLDEQNKFYKMILIQLVKQRNKLKLSDKLKIK